MEEPKPLSHTDISQLELSIAMTTTGLVSSQVAAGLANLFANLVMAGVRTQLHVSDIVDVASARRKLVDAVLETSATHVMWIDGDILVEPNGVLQLIADEKRVVGGLYRKRTFPYFPVACDVTDDGTFTTKFSLDLNGLNQVAGMGMGCVLIETDIYREMSKHFGDDMWYVFDPDLGEDLWFYRRLAEMGVDIWLDGRVRCGHETRQVITVDGNWSGLVLKDGR